MGSSQSVPSCCSCSQGPPQDICTKRLETEQTNRFIIPISPQPRFKETIFEMSRGRNSRSPIRQEPDDELINIHPDKHFRNLTTNSQQLFNSKRYQTSVIGLHNSFVDDESLPLVKSEKRKVKQLAIRPFYTALQQTFSNFEMKKKALDAIISERCLQESDLIIEFPTYLSDQGGAFNVSEAEIEQNLYGRSNSCTGTRGILKMKIRSSGHFAQNQIQDKQKKVRFRLARPKKKKDSSPRPTQIESQSKHVSKGVSAVPHQQSQTPPKRPANLPTPAHPKKKQMSAKRAK